MNELNLVEMKNTMRSVDLLAMLNVGRPAPMLLKHLHESIKTMFPDEIKEGTEIVPTTDSRGYVAKYRLELGEEK